MQRTQLRSQHQPSPSYSAVQRIGELGVGFSLACISSPAHSPDSLDLAAVTRIPPPPPPPNKQKKPPPHSQNRQRATNTTTTTTTTTTLCLRPPPHLPPLSFRSYDAVALSASSTCPPHMNGCAPAGLDLCKIEAHASRQQQLICTLHIAATAAEPTARTEWREDSMATACC